MLVKASIIRIILIHSFEFISSLGLFFFIFGITVKTIEKDFLISVLIILSAYVLGMLLNLFLLNYNVEFDEELGFVGGKKCASFRSLRFIPSVREQQFVSKLNIDLERSNNRGLFDRIFGRYRVYNTDGQCFVINKHRFGYDDFETIRAELHKIFGLKIV